MREFFLSSLVAILVCWCCIFLLRPLAIHIGLIDYPGERKQHKYAAPMIGGIAIFFGFCCALLPLSESLFPYYRVLAGAALLLVIGVFDDYRDLSPQLRLIGQLVAALILCYWGRVLLQQAGDLFFTGNIAFGLCALPITVFIVIAYINAFNMVDGQDGLAGCVALSQVMWLFVFARQLQLPLMMSLLTVLFALLVVFLLFNMSLPWRRDASIFLGDSGSTLLAYLIAWMGISISQHNIDVVKPVAILWVMALPIFDLVSVVIYRLRQKKSIFAAGRDHVHHVLHFMGVNKSLSTLLLSLLSLSFGAIGYFLNLLGLASAVLFGLWLLGLWLYLMLINRVTRYVT